MKIGIMTFWESQDNYGQILQGFALQKYLKNEGHDAFTIKYKRIPPKDQRTIWDRLKGMNIKKLKDFLKQRLSKSRQLPNRNFDSFKNTYMSFGNKVYLSLEDLLEDPPIADVYITGSDQVWNNRFKVPCEPFLLGFGGDDIKRVAYAASFGVTDLDDNMTRLFKKHLPAFDRIGVREEGGVRLCQTLGFSEAVWTPDPTLLFDAKDWIENLGLPKPNQPPSDSKKIFIYTLGNSKIVDRNKYIRFLKRLPGATTKHVSANGDIEGDFFPGIREWVQELRSSDFVLTNSFHGMVFCLIFNKNFVILPNTGHVVGMNDRINSLLKKIDLETHLMVDFDKNILQNILSKNVNWIRVNDIIKTWVYESLPILKF